MSEEKKKTAATSETKLTRRSMLKRTGAVAAAAAVIGAGIGYGTSELLRPTVPSGPAVTTTETSTLTATTSAAAETQVYLSQWKEYGILQVEVKDGRVVRTYPFKGLPGFAHNLGERYRTYSTDRLQYPMKRVGWVPGGKSNIANRGKGEFVRITWQEAYDSIVSELKRILQTYGPSAFLFAPGEHSNSWMYHNRYTWIHEFLSLLGGYTALGCDGLSWGSERGSGASICGAITSSLGSESIQTILDQIKGGMVVWFDRDPLVTSHNYGTFDDLGIQMPNAGIQKVFVCGGMDETCKNFKDTWIPCHPYGTTALFQAIAYVWITEGTYDREGINTHAIGFDEEHLPASAPKGSSYKEYLLGNSDGVPKTPEWAEPICGVKPRIIRALARKWAKGPTSIGGFWRGANITGGQYLRAAMTLQQMQGHGRRGMIGGGGGSQELTESWRDNIKGYPTVVPGGENRMSVLSHDTQAIATRLGLGTKSYFFYHVIPVELAELGWNALAEARYPDPVTQVIRDVLWDVSMNNASPDKPIYHRYTIGKDSVLYRYPMPGHSEAHAYITAGGNYQARCPNSNAVMRALLSPKLEFLLFLDPWMEPDCKFADILLPTTTNLEHNDISYWREFDSYSQKCIPDLYESKSDRDIWTDLARMMGISEKFNQGMNSVDEWLKLCYSCTSLSKYEGTWEQFKKKGYHEWPTPDTWHPAPNAAWNSASKRFYDNPQANKKNTPSGLIEIYSESTAKVVALGQHGYYIHDDPTMSDPTTKKYESPNPGPDPLCPPIPAYVPNPEGKGTPMGDKYPIAVMTCHPKYFYHTSYQNVKWLQDEERKEIGGYSYCPIWMSKKDADARGIKYGDLVRVFNDRGQILCWAEVSEMIMPGVARAHYGQWNDYVEPGKPGSLDKSGNIENLCKGGFISPYDTQTDVQAVAQVEKWKG